jgi:hypothetical protein
VASHQPCRRGDLTEDVSVEASALPVGSARRKMVGRCGESKERSEMDAVGEKRLQCEALGGHDTHE